MSRDVKIIHLTGNNVIFQPINGFESFYATGIGGIFQQNIETNKQQTILLHFPCKHTT